MNSIKYTEGYKYQLEEEHITKTPIIGYTIDTFFIKLTPIGVLTLSKGYAWDGPSGPTFDSKTSMRGSAEHDAFYKLMRMGLIPITERFNVDQAFKATLLKDGMSPRRANIWYKGVRGFASSAADIKNKKKVITAP